MEVVYFQVDVQLDGRCSAFTEEIPAVPKADLSGFRGVGNGDCPHPRHATEQMDQPPWHKGMKLFCICVLISMAKWAGSAACWPHCVAYCSLLVAVLIAAEDTP
ncbi:Disp Complex Protein Lrch3 [Manis pentadactyla]|nr:Disp Complex Protein Lrch3 [Manis pentadactyla]